MFTKLVTSLGNDVIVLNIEGCVSIVGFRDYISKTFKVTKLDSVDEEKEDELVRKIKTEAQSILTSNKSYDISDFTHDSHNLSNIVLPIHETKRHLVWELNYTTSLAAEI